MVKILYNPELKQRARELRKQGVLSEVLLWKELKGRKVLGYQFMRQKSVGEYIVDFYCSKLKLVIEIDGESHKSRYDYNIQKQRDLESIGLTMLRFNDVDVKQNMPNVLMVVKGWIKHNPLNPLY
ncbi:MAG: DNA methylase [Elusimicrobia bacterium HGW-Elusimicrobia-1]|nr:MAG: DNA methylase [Elusimicrobia bacterium HGW-Elusimicrobia-1]